MRIAPLLVGLSLMLPGVPAHAAWRPAISAVLAPAPEAVAAFEEGQEAFSQADYHGALDAFRLAQQIQPAPALHYNIGVCHLRLGQYGPAIEALEQYLEEADPPDRADIEFMIDDARRRIEDEEHASQVPEPIVETKVVYVEAKPYMGLIIGGGTAIGVGVVGGATAVASLAVAVRKRSNQIEEFNGSMGTSDDLDVVLDLEKEANTLETMQYVALGIGLALVAGGAAALVIGLRRRAAAGAAGESQRGSSRQTSVWGVPTGTGGALVVRF